MLFVSLQSTGEPEEGARKEAGPRVSSAVCDLNCKRYNTVQTLDSKGTLPNFVGCSWTYKLSSRGPRFVSTVGTLSPGFGPTGGMVGLIQALPCNPLLRGCNSSARAHYTANGYPVANWIRTSPPRTLSLSQGPHPPVAWKDYICCGAWLGLMALHAKSTPQSHRFVSRSHAKTPTVACYSSHPSLGHKKRLPR